VEGDDDGNGPKRMRDVSIWALGEFYVPFSCFLVCFFITNTNLWYIQVIRVMCKVTTTKIGPNGCKTRSFGP
jgi:hypothetical protein